MIGHRPENHHHFDFLDLNRGPQFAQTSQEPDRETSSI
jgi:hypothetical protein